MKYSLIGLGKYSTTLSATVDSDEQDDIESVDSILENAVATRSLDNLPEYSPTKSGVFAGASVRLASEVACLAVEKKNELLVAALAKDVKLNPSHLAADGDTLFIKLMSVDYYEACMTFADAEIDWYARARSRVSHAACLITSPRKRVRDALLSGTISRGLRQLDREAIERKTNLTAAQKDVLWHGRADAKKRSESQTEELCVRLESLAQDIRPSLQQMRSFMRTRAALIINFPPSAIGSMTADGLYRNIFETGTSMGHKDASVGAPRDTWENKIFAGKYHKTTLVPAERPKYGSVSCDNSVAGVQHYGPFIFQLADHMRSRVTITPRDSSYKFVTDVDVGTLAYADHVLNKISDSKLRMVAAATQHQYNFRPDDDLEYIEMQVHGSIDLRNDIKKIRLNRNHVDQFSNDVIDSVFEMAKKFDVPVSWRGTYKLGSRDRQQMCDLAMKHNWNIQSWFYDTRYDYYTFVSGISDPEKTHCYKFLEHTFQNSNAAFHLSPPGKSELIGFGHNGKEFILFQKDTIFSGGRFSEMVPDYEYRIVPIEAVDSFYNFGWETHAAASVPGVYSEVHRQPPANTALIKRIRGLTNVTSEKIETYRGFTLDQAHSLAKHQGSVHAVWGRASDKTYTFAIGSNAIKEK